MSILYKIILVAMALGLTACGEFDSKSISASNKQSKTSDDLPPDDIPPDVKPPADSDVISWPAFAWDNKHADYLDWNEFVYEGVGELGESLIKKTPSDITNFCPKFDSLNEDGKKMFWISLVSAMSRYESNFKPETSYEENFEDANGNKIISRGLLQLSIESALGYSCPLSDAQDLHDPKLNLECGIRILDRWIGRDGVISDKVSGNWKGGARYWSVLRTPSTVAKIKNITTNFELCK